MIQKKQLVANGLLFLTAAVWGFSMVAQRISTQSIGPLTFNGSRYLLGAVSLLPLIFLDRRRKRSLPTPPPKQDKKMLIKASFLSACTLFAGSSAQQIGLIHTAAGKATFLTALYIVIIPVAGFFMGKKIGKQVWVGILCSIGGLYLLCVKEDFSIASSDVIILIGTFFFAAQILIVEHYSPKLNALHYSCIQFLFTSGLCFIAMLFFEKPTFEQLAGSILPILYVGVFAVGVGYTLQVIAQKNTAAHMAGLILCLDTVFASISGYFFLNETLTIRELIGCAMMLSAAFIAQVPLRTRSKKEAIVVSERPL